MSRAPARTGLAVALLGLLLGGLLGGLTACAEIESSTDDGYQPATLSEPDARGVRVVELTQLAADRVELKTARVQSVRGRLTVPYDALVYDGKGGAWVYQVIGDLTYRRAPVEVASTEGATVVLSVGPPVGSEIVTQGAMQVYGSEVEMAGKH